jgi:hypothetical protein
MKIKTVHFFLFTYLFFSCQNENNQLLVEQKIETKKREVIFNNINKGWIFNVRSIEPSTQVKTINWLEWNDFLIEVNQKPKSTIGAFQKKATDLAKKATSLYNNIPYEFNKPQVISRVTVLVTKAKAIELFIKLNQIQDKKVIQLVSDMNIEINSLQLQLEEITRRSQIPIEEGEPDRIKMMDSTRAIPNTISTEPDLE